MISKNKSLQCVDFGDLLTICVPTYNREAILFEGVNDLIRKVEKYNLPIIVLDNCSTDGTKRIKEFEEKYKHLSYFCQSSNKGYDINFETALKLSKTPYTWVIADANRLNEDNILPILKSLKEKLPDAYIVNSRKRVKLKPYVFSSVNELIADMGWHMTMLSVTIFSRQIIENAKFEKYRNTNFLHFGVLFDYFATLENFTVLWEGYEMIRTSKLAKSNSWNPYRVAEIFGKDWTQVVLSLPDTISDDAKVKCIIRHGQYTKLFSFKHLRKQRAVNGLNPTIFEEVEPYIRYFAPNRKWLIRLVSKMPNFINEYYWKYKKQNKLTPLK